MGLKTDYMVEDGLTYEVRVFSNGNKFWYYKGKFHRLSGPAVELANGGKHYYINDKHYSTFEEYKEAIVQIKIKEILNER